MLSSPARFSRMRHIVTAVTIVSMAGGLVLVVMGATWGDAWQRIWLLTGGGVIVGAAAVVGVLTRLVLKIESNTSRLYTQAREFADAIERYGKAVERVAENTLISDAAKSIAHRDQERDALRGAIYDEVRREDFEAAFHLIDDLDRRLGYREEAERLRDEIRNACTDAFRQKLKEAFEHVHSLLAKHRWVQARSEIERIEKIMPNEPRVKELWTALDHHREVHKQDLIASWKEEAAKRNVERCLDIIKELDPYLSRAEAREMESSAREIFKERLLQLGTQFQFAVNERRWQDALASGLEIIEGFPNSRMAHEVNDNLAALRARAGISTEFEVTAKVPARSDGSKGNR